MRRGPLSSPPRAGRAHRQTVLRDRLPVAGPPREPADVGRRFPGCARRPIPGSIGSGDRGERGGTGTGGSASIESASRRSAIRQLPRATTRSANWSPRSVSRCSPDGSAWDVCRDPDGSAKIGVTVSSPLSRLLPQSPTLAALAQILGQRQLVLLDLALGLQYRLVVEVLR